MTIIVYILFQKMSKENKIRWETPKFKIMKLKDTASGGGKTNTDTFEFTGIKNGATTRKTATS